MVSGRLVEIGRDVRSRLKRFFDVPLGADAAPLEIAQAAIEEIEHRLQPVGRGVRVLPAPRIILRLRPGDDRQALEATFARFEERLRARLAELGCDTTPLELRIVHLKKAPPDWPADQLYTIEYQQASQPRADAAAVAQPAASAVHLTIIRGAAPRKAYTFNEPTISIGRTADPTDDLGRVRRNRLAFLDTVDGVTETVGRAHARLQLDPAGRRYVLFDEGSSNGTSIARGGTTIPVPPRDPRGVLVLSGDEIHLGRAVIKVVVDGH